MAISRAFSVIAIGVLSLSGCARYEFNLVKPERFAAVVNDKSDETVSVDPLEYRFRAKEGFLIVRIHNTTDAPIQLLGDQSSAIDASGEAHPLKSQAIPPGAFVKVIVPPPRPTVYDEGPDVGIGFGVIGQVDYSNWRGGLYDPWWDQNRIYTMNEEGNNYYWDWKANTTVKLIFAYQSGGKVLHQEFSFFKRKL